MPTVSKPPKQDRSRETLERIMQAGFRVLSTQGWDGFTIAAVAKESGLSGASPYRRFKDKDELLLALHRRFSDELHERWFPEFQAVAASGLGLEPLTRQLMSALARSFRYDEGLMRVFILRAAVDPRFAVTGEAEVQAVAREFEQALLAHRELFRCPDPELAVQVTFEAAFDTFTRLVIFGTQANPALGWDELTEQLSRMALAYFMTE